VSDGEQAGRVSDGEQAGQVSDDGPAGRPQRHAGGRLTRRRVLGYGLGGLAGLATAGAGGVELVAHGVLPGRYALARLDGACNASGPTVTFGSPGPSFSGTFYSHARRREVGFTIAYPPGHGRGDRLPLIIALHAYGGYHGSATGMWPMAHALAMRVGGRPLPPMAMVAADGGGGYWNPHPGDDPMGMVIHELIPLCRRLGLGSGSSRIGTMGISMGGYGAILLAEKYPDLFTAAAAISPAIWMSYAQARSVNPGAYASAAAFARANAVTHARALSEVAVRVATGLDDPFLPGVRALVARLPRGAVVDIAQGCHTTSFFAAQEPLSLAFLGRHLAGV
jgi:enterochelin esterase-like enzyme